MKKTLCSTILLMQLGLHGEQTGTYELHENNNQNQEIASPPPFDADLFRRDVQCYSFHGDFLFWRVQEAALDYALKMTGEAWGPDECYAQGEYKNAKFNGNPGFRFSFVFFRAPKYWEFWTQYTRLSASGSDKACKPHAQSEYLNGTFPQLFTEPMALAKSYIHLNYNVSDVFVTRVFFPNPHLRLRCAAGGVVAWMDQFWKICYQDSIGQETKIANQWKFIGGGLRLGTLFDWYWFTDIYMTGAANFAALLGSYHNSARQVTNIQPSPSYNPSKPVRYTRFSDIRPTFECQFYLGPSYQKNFTNQRLECFVGYEMTVWWNLQEVFRSTSGTAQSAKETSINSALLALQGLTAKVSLDF